MCFPLNYGSKVEELRLTQEAQVTLIDNRALCCSGMRSQNVLSASLTNPVTVPWRTGILPQVPSFNSTICLASAFSMGQWRSAHLESAPHFSRYPGSWGKSLSLFPGNGLHLVCVSLDSWGSQGKPLAGWDTDLVCLD